MDIIYHILRYSVEDGIIKVIFVKGEDNSEDPYTKNVKKEVLKKHFEEVVCENMSES